MKNDEGSVSPTPQSTVYQIYPIYKFESLGQLEAFTLQAAALTSSADPLALAVETTKADHDLEAADNELLLAANQAKDSAMAACEDWTAGISDLTTTPDSG